MACSTYAPMVSGSNPANYSFCYVDVYYASTQKREICK